MIGTHNSFSYLKPKNFIGKIFNFVSKCQDKDIYKQISKSRCIDLRVAFTDKGKIQLRHGLTIYHNDARDLIKEVLEYCNYHADDFYVRVILEKLNNNTYNFLLFQKFCDTIKKKFPNIIFIGGRYKKTWVLVYNFGNDINDTKVEQYVSSMQHDAKWYEKICPRLYAKRMNVENILSADIEKINLFDFV